MKNFTKGMVLLTMLSSSMLSAVAQENKPKVNVGLLLHTYVTAEQSGFGQTSVLEEASDWGVGASLYRARMLFDAKLSSKDYIFIESDLTASVGLGADKAASIKILDAQYDHKFCDAFVVSAGKQLVSFNRNGLQTAGTLMANDFAYFQYMPCGDIMGNDCGRDIGINFSGVVANDKLSYRLGSFLGDVDKSLRVTGRVQYNFFDKDLYSGTNLGEGKTLSIGAGFDTQAEYLGAGLDAYLDMPVGEAGSLTANLAYAYTTGNVNESRYMGSDLPAQNIYFAELGYYFKSCKLQPWVKYELSSQTNEAGMDDTVFGGGLNYFFNGYGTNLRLSYLARENSYVNKTYSLVQLQLQLFIF